MIKDRLKEFKHSLPEGVTLVAVSKTKPSSLILEAYEAGQRDFGENKVQEMVEKAALLPKDIRWHLIGHLQTNKVKYIAPFVHLIHSVDSLKLLAEINRQALKNGRIIDILLQFHVAKEETKFGLSLEEAEALLRSSEYAQMKNIRITGIMGMASFTEDDMQVRHEFSALTSIFDYLKNRYFQDLDFFKERSMGMSGDYKIAMEEGSTMIRIGSTIFGERTLPMN
jgi:pyridoxal phosphate enzyme (YggS family)